MQFWNQYRNIFIRRRMVREASRFLWTSLEICPGLATGLLAVLNSAEPGYQLEGVVHMGLGILGSRGHEKTYTLVLTVYRFHGLL